MSTKPIWSPSEDLVAQSNLTSFQKYINSKYNTNLKTYDALHKWSVNSLNDFWSSLIEYEKIIYKGSLFPHIDGDMRMPGTKWYPNMKLNFAQNLSPKGPLILIKLSLFVFKPKKSNPKNI